MIEPPPIQVAVAADVNFLMPLAVTLRSVALAHAPGEVVATVLYDGLRDSHRERVAAGAPGLRLSWVEVPPERLDRAHHPEFLTRATLFRLLLPELLPVEIDRLLYLDIDTVVTRPLRSLWETELSGTIVAAARDAGTPFAAGPLGPDWRGLGLEPSDPYFNAGVMLAELDAWRSAEVSRRSVELLRTHPLRWGDQCALNAVWRGRVTEVSRRFNLQTVDVLGTGLAWALWRDDVESALADTAVIHFNDRVKPWHPGTHNPLEWRWYEVLDGTSWAGWRPGPDRRPLYRRAGSRAKSAWRALTAPSLDPQAAA